MNTVPPRRKLEEQLLTGERNLHRNCCGQRLCLGWPGQLWWGGTVQDCPESRVTYALAPNQHFIQNCYGKAAANCFCKRSEGRGFAHCHNGVCSLSCASAVKHTSVLIAETGPGAFNTSKLVLSPVNETSAARGVWDSPRAFPMGQGHFPPSLLWAWVGAASCLQGAWELQSCFEDWNFHSSLPLLLYILYKFL